MLLIARTCESGAAAECALGAFGGGGGEKHEKQPPRITRALDPDDARQKVDRAGRVSVNRLVFHR